MKKVLLTGAHGQLGQCIGDAALEFPELNLFYADKSQLDITSAVSLKELFELHSFDYCINTAAYTNVEKAESEREMAFSVNAEGVKYLASKCKEHDVVLLHISTDYVFDGKKRTPYLENDGVGPINVYGASKLRGEQYIQEIWEKHFIFRTSWLYSQYGQNFYKAMRQFAAQGKKLSITTEQLGTPTNANDLAKFLCFVIANERKEYGIYHFSNEGIATWYDFAHSIFVATGELDTVKLAKTDHYRTFAARPDYSVMSNKKLSAIFHLSSTNWIESLHELIKDTNNNK
ncbi:MAG: dTDP-4-dehydrorhamnose reductase [Bacteroidetes bacterium]|nr:dTDP-4-dehydrorhamnose reductase [Bacteroidota bacterium]